MCARVVSEIRSSWCRYGRMAHDKLPKNRLTSRILVRNVRVIDYDSEQFCQPLKHQSVVRI